MLSPPGVVEVYDSMPAYSTHSSVLKRQVAAVLQTPQSAFELRHVNVQHQVGGSDCGLFTITFAVALCSGLDPLRCSFKQAQMRSHLLLGQMSFMQRVVPSIMFKYCARHHQ